jgi:hypothetical protein
VTTLRGKAALGGVNASRSNRVKINAVHSWALQACSAQALESFSF